MMLKKNFNLLKSLFCFFLIIATFISVVSYCCFDYSFYNSEYKKLNIADNIGISDSDLDKLTHVLLDYTNDNRDDLNIEVKIKGDYRQAFYEREILHMKDVKDLYHNVMISRNISFVFIIIFGLILFFNNEFKNMNNSYIKVLLFFLCIFIFIGLFCLIDFNVFWTGFHELFFPNNDYWLLNVNTSVLVNMVPEQFFFDLCIKIVIMIIIFLVIYFLIFKLFDKKKDNSNYD